MKKLTLIFLFSIISFAVFAQEKPEIKVLEPAEYKKEISQESIQFIDVRTPEEFEAGSIEGAKNIDFLADDFLKKMEVLDKNGPVYIYCRSGNRSAKAAAQLTEMGFQQVIDLKGGYKAWQDFAEE